MSKKIIGFIIAVIIIAVIVAIVVFTNKGDNNTVESNGSAESTYSVKYDGVEIVPGTEFNADNIKKEAEAILSDARKSAKKAEAEIIAEAKEEAHRIRTRALKEIELEKKHVLDDMKKEMISIASIMAGKVVSANMNTQIQETLIEETLKEIGDNTWQK